MRRVGDRRKDVVVPTVRVVVRDDDRGVAPVFRLLDGVDFVDEEVLLVDRVGVTRMAVLVLAGLEEADRRQRTRLQRLLEVMTQERDPAKCDELSEEVWRMLEEREAIKEALTERES